MKYIRWNEELSVDNPIIDEQHKELFRTINEFYTAIAEKKNKLATQKAIEEMENYIKTHFTSEEIMMKNAGYEGLDQHLNEHQFYIDKVQDLRERYEQGRLILSLEVTNFIKDWITNHIMVTDQKYKGKI
ncbi:MAG: hemerythrin family protein [Prolixibacteraceae bacterium]|nr:hemerythrin family protein [Prolixibacteraceae bacterium]MBN2648548.1 hemerythrin family protein [Prolixibacteraceae bacterium]